MFNNNFRNKLIVFLLLGILISMFSINQTGISKISLVPSAPFLISSDADFIAFGFPGFGNESHPYLIENYEITTTEQSGIFVTGTTKHFVIRNCVITAEAYAIFVDSVAPGTVEIRENNCDGNIQGIMVWSASSSIVANNTCIENESYSIYVENSPNSIVANNSCSGNSYGMLILFCAGSIIANNTYTNEGLDLYDSTIDDLLSYSVYNNYANGKPIGWITNLHDVEMNISLYNQLYLINCTRCTVAGQSMQNSLKGITLFFCANTTIYKNTLNHIGYEGAGIYIVKSENTTVEENTISNFNYGIAVRSNSINTNITNNICSNCFVGISVWSTEALVQYNNIRNGLQGIRASSTSNLDISQNTIENNDYYGIQFHSMDFSSITHNIIRNNGYYAVYLDDTCVNNIIHHNSFISNRLDPGSQAYDSGTNNIWYDVTTNEGNGWDDLESETTYQIDGSAGSVDLYPTNLAPIPEFQQIASLVLILSLFGVTFITFMLRKHKNKV